MPPFLLLRAGHPVDARSRDVVPVVLGHDVQALVVWPPSRDIPDVGGAEGVHAELPAHEQGVRESAEVRSEHGQGEGDSVSSARRPCSLSIETRIPNLCWLFPDTNTPPRAFKDHEEEVKRTVPPDRLLVYSVKEGWEPLCEFLGVPVPDEPFPRVNDTNDFHLRLRRLHDMGTTAIAIGVGLLAVVAAAVVYFL